MLEDEAENTEQLVQKPAPQFANQQRPASQLAQKQLSDSGISIETPGQSILFKSGYTEQKIKENGEQNESDKEMQNKENISKNKRSIQRKERRFKKKEEIDSRRDSAVKEIYQSNSSLPQIPNEMSQTFIAQQQSQIDSQALQSYELESSPPREVKRNLQAQFDGSLQECEKSEFQEAPFHKEKIKYFAYPIPEQTQEGDISRLIADENIEKVPTVIDPALINIWAGGFRLHGGSTGTFLGDSHQTPNKSFNSREMGTYQSQLTLSFVNSNKGYTYIASTGHKSSGGISDYV